MKIECEGLTKKYFTKTAVDHADLELSGGHIYPLSKIDILYAQTYRYHEKSYLSVSICGRIIEPGKLNNHKEVYIYDECRKGEPVSG
jgi:hypothetical protein